MDFYAVIASSDARNVVISKGFVPKTCTRPLTDFRAINDDAKDGKSPCFDCAHDRKKCRGQPRDKERLPGKAWNDVIRTIEWPQGHAWRALEGNRPCRCRACIGSRH